jgi:hypothetical protein
LSVIAPPATTRQAAANRQITYGQQRVGGVEIYLSTTGSELDQYNYVIVLAGHVCHSIQNLYLDARQVFWLGSGPGYSVQNGIGFGGVADNNSHTGPSGQQYNFGGTGHSGIFAEARYGDQVSGDFFTSLQANDPNWGPTANGNPYVGGCTVIYLKVEFNTNLFPTPPEIRITVNGKDTIFDPRTGTTGFTSNWALIAADVITDPVFGMGDSSVNQAQLIAAANVCDEQVPLAALPGQTESRYTTNYHFDSSVAPIDALQAMMPGAQGRISRVGGEWFLWPAFFQGSSFTFDENSLTAPAQWRGFKSKRSLFNRVGGTYIAPNFPFNVAGNAYDGNGFDSNGQAQNNFELEWTPTNYPQYASDTLHGFASDQFLNEDGGVPLYKELGFQTVISVTQAERCAKIALLRNRQQGSGTFEMALSAYQMQPTDVMEFTFPAQGWTEKMLEVTGINFRVVQDQSGTPSVRCSVPVIETDESVYDWNPTAEELTVLDVPASPNQVPRVPAPPTDMALTSGASTAVIGADGSVQPRIEVQWSTPQDVLTTQIQIQYQQVDAASWISAPSVDVSLNAGFITGVVAGQQYNVRIRSVRANGATSAFEEIDGFTVSLTLSVLGLTSVAPAGTLIAEAFSGGTASIIVEPFTAQVGSISVSCLPAGEFTISGLAQSTLYFVYYVDPTFAGGAITPIATTNTADFIAKVGFFLIGSIVTTTAGSGGGAGGGATRFSPASFTDQGTRTTQNPTSAFDGNSASAAIVGASETTTNFTIGNCVWSFGAAILSSAATLTVSASATLRGLWMGDVTISATVAGTTTELTSFAANAATASYTLPIPSGTNLSSVSVQVVAQGEINDALSSGSGSSGNATANVSIFEIFIQ